MKKHPLDGLDDDIRDHLERETQDNIDRGMTPQDARAAALRKFGNVALVREDARAVWIPVLADQAMQDVRYALRTMRRQPGFTIASVAMLAIGLGLVAGGYTVFNGLFLRGWAVPANDRVFRVEATRVSAPTVGYVSDGVSDGAVDFIRRSATAADYATLRIETFRIAAQPDPRGTHTQGMIVSPDAIDTLGIPMQLGSGFAGPAAAGPRAVMSDGIWRRLFGADPAIVGRTAWIGAQPVTIVGVTARGFDGLGERPLDVVVDTASAVALGKRGSPVRVADGTWCCAQVVGRLRDGWTRAQMQQELQLLVARYRADTGQPPLTVELITTAAGEALRRSRRGNLLVITLTLFGAGFLLVMLLTCANVGNLHLARSLRREREIAVRLSLGASRARVVRQLLTEGLVLAAAAGVCAFAMTASVPYLLAMIEDNAKASMFASDWRVAAFTLAAVVATCLLVSLAPALQTTRIAWRGATPTMSPRTGRVRAVVLAAQIAIASVLVMSATLLARGIGHALAVPADFALHGTTAVRVQTPDGKAIDTRRLAGVASAARANGLPAGLAETTPVSERSGFPTSTRAQGSDVEFRCLVMPFDAAAFGVLDLRLSAGRLASDDGHAREAVVNETLARQMWPRQSALGKTFTLAFDRTTYTVVGVTRDAHLTGPALVEPLVHVPPRGAGLHVLLMKASPALEPRVKAVLASIDPQLTATFTPLSASVKRTLANAKGGAAVAGALGAVALALAIIGVFGVFSYLVEERRQEIGIRLALGASRRQIGAALLRATRGAVAGGLVAGLALSALAGIALRRFLFGMSPADPVSYAAVAAVLAVAALVATAVPIRRALRVDPAVTLRTD
jgi:predicted permease